MIDDVDTACAHGKLAGVKCIFCPGQVAKVPAPTKGAKIAVPAPSPPAPVPGIRQAAKEPAHRRADPPRIGTRAEDAPRDSGPAKPKAGATDLVAENTAPAPRRTPAARIAKVLGEKPAVPAPIPAPPPPAAAPMKPTPDQEEDARLARQEDAAWRAAPREAPAPLPPPPPDIVPPSQTLPSPEPATFVLSVNIGTAASRHLHALVRTGFYGTTIERVAEILLLEGLRRAQQACGITGQASISRSERR